MAETVMFLCFAHDFHLNHFLRCTEMVCKTIFYTFGEVIRIVVMCKTQTLDQSLQQTTFSTLSSKTNVLKADLFNTFIRSCYDTLAENTIKTQGLMIWNSISKPTGNFNKNVNKSENFIKISITIASSLSLLKML